MLDTYILRSEIEFLLYRSFCQNQETRLQAEKEGQIKLPKGCDFPEVECKILWESEKKLIFLLPKIMPAYSFIPPFKAYGSDPIASAFGQRKMLDWIVMRKIWSDAQARAQLHAQPRAAIERWIGMPMPASWDIQVEDEKDGDLVECVMPILVTVGRIEDLKGLNEASGWQLHHAELHAFKVLGGSLWATKIR